MSRSQPRDFWVYVQGPRAADFEQVFGTVRVPVLSPAPHPAMLPGFDQAQPVYLLDLEWVAEHGLRQALVDHIAARFAIPAEAVEENLDEQGVPILAADTTLQIDHPQRWL